MAELTTLARPYARAAFETANEADCLNAWSNALRLAATVIGEPSVKTALASPSLTGEEQASLVSELCDDEIGGPMQNFIMILAENKRVSLMQQIVVLFEELKANQEKKVDVNVTTAFPLSDSIEDKLTNSLKEKLQRDVVLRSQIDKSLIGGVIVRAGDLVIDGSVRGKLAKLVEAMKN